MKLYIADIKKIELKRVNEISEERAEKVKRLKKTDDKKRCIAGGLFINKFLSDTKISINEFGKPIADNGKYFNISHSGDYVLFALSEYEVGCDIQKIRHVRTFDIAKTVFCSAELKSFGKSPDKLGSFYDLWTKKESLLKCMGEGFHRNSKSVDVSSDIFKVKGKKYYFRTWNFSDYVISVCTEHNDFPPAIEFIDLGVEKGEGSKGFYC